MNKPDLPFDVAIIGAGAVGSAIARELSRYELSIILLEVSGCLAAQRIMDKVQTEI